MKIYRLLCPGPPPSAFAIKNFVRVVENNWGRRGRNRHRACRVLVGSLGLAVHAGGTHCGTSLSAVNPPIGASVGGPKWVFCSTHYYTSIPPRAISQSQTLWAHHAMQSWPAVHVLYSVGDSGEILAAVYCRFIVSEDRRSEGDSGVIMEAERT
jgi:hypothetical protein